MFVSPFPNSQPHHFGAELIIAYGFFAVFCAPALVMLIEGAGGDFAVCIDYIILV